MSNYGSMPPPGAYTPPNQSTPAPGQKPQQQPVYGHTGAPNAGQSAHGHKSGGGAFGQMMNQAVTTGKPMLNKLSKTISSKLGGKPAAGGPPQHLQSYQNYQEHTQPQAYQQQQQQQQQGQTYASQPEQQQGQTYSPQPQQRPWQPPPGPPPPSTQTQNPNTYSTPQQSPYPQASNYGTPASAHSGQSTGTYFPSQNTQPPNQTQQGQYQQNQQWQAGQYDGQQSGVVGTSQSPGYPQNTHGSHMGDVSPVIPPNKPVVQQPSWRHPSQPQQPPPPDSQPQQHNPTVQQQPPHSPTSAQQAFQSPVISQSPYQPVPSPPIQQGQQQWATVPPMGPQGHAPQPPHSVSPPPQQMYARPQAPPNLTSKPSQPPTPGSQHAAPQQSPSNEFIAELPADMGNMNISGSKPQGSDQPVLASQYQAYQPQGAQSAQSGSPTNRFSVPRRAVSASSLPLADPWRFAHPTTEQPTREFYILADLLFDALDRKFEPQNTGLLEGPKVLRSWIELSPDAYQLFSHNNYTALAHMWSLEGVPHVMVPVQPSLTPVWNFNQHSHGQDVKVIAEPPSGSSSYATYMPALNRAGWYKFLFLEAMHGPEDVCKLLPALCGDTYKPGVMNHPDLNKRDGAELPALQARAAQVQSLAIKRVCEEAKADMVRKLHPSAGTSQPPSASPAPSSVQAGSQEEMDLLMYQIQQQANSAMVRAVSDDVYTYRSGHGKPGGYV